MVVLTCRSGQDGIRIDYALEGGMGAGLSLAGVEWQGFFVGLTVWRGGVFRGSVAVFVIDTEEAEVGT